MATRYSIAQARDRLARLVHDAEKGAAVELTRRGKPVAVLVSVSDYRRLRSSKLSFWKALEKFRREVDLKAAAVEPEVFRGVRDRSTGREVSF